MSLTHNDVVKLLALVAAIDDVEVTPARIEAWKALAVEGQWESFEAARRALIVYRSEHPDFPVRPGHITAVLERVRAEARHGYREPRMPEAIRASDDPMAYPEWARNQARLHREHVIAQFATGDQRPLHQIAGSS